jgi:hypothetical protein
MTKKHSCRLQAASGKLAEGGWRHPIQDAGFRIQGKALEWADRLAY